MSNYVDFHSTVHTPGVLPSDYGVIMLSMIRGEHIGCKKHANMTRLAVLFNNPEKANIFFTIVLPIFKEITSQTTGELQKDRITLFTKTENYNIFQQLILCCLLPHKPKTKFWNLKTDGVNLKYYKEKQQWDYIDTADYESNEEWMKGIDKKLE